MEWLSTTAWGRARAFMLSRARPIERELFLHHHEGRRPDGVVAALEAFRNPDGGFGNALESDYRAKESSVLATCIALTHLHGIGAGKDHPMVLGGIRYLLDVFDAKQARWVIVAAGGDGAPHAPWWSWDGLEETFSGFRINPIAEVLALLFNLGGADGHRLASSLLPRLRERVLAAAALEPSEVICLLALQQSRLDEPGMRGFLETFLPACIARSVEKDPGKWGSYCLKPLWAVPGPHAPGAAELRETIEEALDFEIRAQAEDGAWDPHWTWEDVSPEHWPAARAEWRGWLTLKTLGALRAHDRVALT